jgi:hypothetical protein
MRGNNQRPTPNIEHPTSNTESESEGSAKRAGGKKCCHTPVNKGDFVINTGYTPSYHRGGTGKTPSARAERY